MFCPLRSGPKDQVSCSRRCAWYTGSIDGKEPACAVYSLAVALESSRSALVDLGKNADELSGAVNALADQARQ